MWQRNTHQTLIFFGTLTLFGMGGMGLLILFWAHNILPSQFFMAGAPLSEQLFRGFIFALVAALNGWILAQSELWQDSKDRLMELIQDWNPNLASIIFLSACAGVGEEILFRGAIQPWLGVWPTALLFIALHGYLKLTDPTTWIFGGIMTAVSAGFGYLQQEYGIWSAMFAHTLYDILLLVYFKKITV